MDSVRNNLNISKLKKLCMSCGIPGFEEEPRKVFIEACEPFADAISTDVMGNCYAVLNPGGSPKIMLDAHLDEVGFIVKYIDESGLVYASSAGRVDGETAAGQAVTVHGHAGDVPGCISARCVHLLSSDELSRSSGVGSLWIDIGFSCKDEAEKRVLPGDWVTWKSNFTELGDNRGCSKSLDDRAGVFILTELLRELKGKTDAEVCCVASAQEELGYRGATVAAASAAPEIAIVLDTCYTSDIPGTNKRAMGEIKLGSGPVIVRGPNIDKRISAALIKAAKDNDIPYQVQASAIATGTDANCIQISGSGVAVGLMAIPLRYMHSPVEMVSLQDLADCVRCLKAFIIQSSGNSRS
ncbi:MAG: M20/M25/M40 family metallo-hydrolase [bacterium]|nr:M20/M25/M40 family metallo-hydrolase [bacterium]